MTAFASRLGMTRFFAGRRPSGAGRRLMLTGAMALGVTFLFAGIWISRPISASTLAPSGALGLTIEDRHGLPLRSTRAADGSDARWVVYDRIDPDVINAFVAVEDKRFWEH